MANIYNSLKNIFQDLKKENNANTAFVSIILVLLSIPMAYIANSIAIGILFLSILISFRKENFSFQRDLMYPVIFFVLIALSFIWTIDKESTLKAIPKEISLLIIPLAFFLIKNFSQEQKQKIVKYYSYGIFIYVIFYYLKATIRYLFTQNSSVFFYHELVTKDLNAIHVSVYVAIAFFYFFAKEKQTVLTRIISFFIFCFVILLSSKNIILVFILLILVQVFFFSKMAHRLRLRNLALMVMIVGILLSFGKIKERFSIEFRTNSAESISHNVELNKKEGLNNISIAEAWTKEKFHPSDFFPGTAFRVYQFRMFLELFQQEPIFWTGYGLNASKIKLLEKEKKYNLHAGYGNYNFHNQYVQNFAELGIFGFLILVAMLLINLRNAIKSKDFVHFAFAILMISLFLTESFLWRQRGVVFFTVLYCLFNSKNLIKAHNINT